MNNKQFIFLTICLQSFILGALMSCYVLQGILTTYGVIGATCASITIGFTGRIVFKGLE